jgi:predicted DNA-binding transcriptional regulator YafY
MENCGMEWIGYAIVGVMALGIIGKAIESIGSAFKGESNSPNPRQKGSPRSSQAEGVSMTLTDASDLILRYQDTSSRETQRRVTPREVTGKRTASGMDIQSVEAFCHKRKAPRTFKPGRILQAVDANTGEVLELPQGLARWFEARLQK